MIRRTQAVYVISVAAELAGMHPQTLRIYERRGLVRPARTQGGNRRYSDADIETLRRIAELANEGMNLEGIRRVMQLEAENQRLRAELDEVRKTRDSASLVPIRQPLNIFEDRKADTSTCDRVRAGWPGSTASDTRVNTWWMSGTPGR